MLFQLRKQLSVSVSDRARRYLIEPVKIQLLLELQLNFIAKNARQPFINTFQFLAGSSALLDGLPENLAAEKRCKNCGPRGGGAPAARTRLQP